MSIEIDPDCIEEYRRKGATCVRGFIGAEWVEKMRAATARALEREQQIGPFAARHSLAWQDPEVRDYVFNSPVAHIAGALMRSREVRYYFDQIFCKEPGTDQPTPWHQDVSYWPVSGSQVCSVWLALDDVTRESSGLQYVAGSHLWKEHEVAPLAAWGDEYVKGARDLGLAQPARNEGLDLLPDIDREGGFELLDWDMRPGDCLIHQMNTVHGALGNMTRTQRRRALAVRFLGDDARYRRPNDSADKSLVVPALRPGDRMADARFPVVLEADPRAPGAVA